jgi:hypothetical protein
MRPWKIWCLVVLILTAVLAWGNSALTIRRYTHASAALPVEYDGFRIAHLSDLHGRFTGDSHPAILPKIADLIPDMIVVTGDLINRYEQDPSAAAALLSELNKIAPVYFVPGNHEWESQVMVSLLAQLTEGGVTVLQNQSVTFTSDSGQWVLMGADDPAGPRGLDGLSAFCESRQELQGMTLLLSHRPEQFHLYVAAAIDLVLAGHAHGGQFRLPLIGGLIAPDQGLFPRWTEGPYVNEGTTMIVSRGIGNSIIPLRIGNPPEIVLITLSHQEEN